MRVWKYKKNDYITTGALKRYKEENNLTAEKLAEIAGETKANINSWIWNGRAPKPVLDKLGIKARNRVVTTKANNENHPVGGSFYACYVGKDHVDAFTSFCKALGISAKYVV